MTEAGTVAIIVAILGLIGTFSGSYLANRKNAVLLSYRMEQLEEKVNKHNNLIERTYRLEEKCAIQDEKIRVTNHRLDDLEREVS